MLGEGRSVLEYADRSMQKKLMAFFQHTNYWTEAVRLPEENGNYKLRLLDKLCSELIFSIGGKAILNLPTIQLCPPSQFL